MTTKAQLCIKYSGFDTRFIYVNYRASRNIVCIEYRTPSIFLNGISFTLPSGQYILHSNNNTLILNMTTNHDICKCICDLNNYLQSIFTGHFTNIAHITGDSLVVPLNGADTDTDTDDDQMIMILEFKNIEYDWSTQNYKSLTMVKNKYEY